MTQSTQDKLESIKAALERIIEESEENQRQGDSGNYLIENDSIWVDARAALATLQSLQADIASEEDVKVLLIPCKNCGAEPKVTFRQIFCPANKEGCVYITRGTEDCSFKLWNSENAINTKLQADIASEEMVEKVAKRMYSEGFVLSDGDWTLWDKLSPEYVKKHKQVARAAIKTILGNYVRSR